MPTIRLHRRSLLFAALAVVLGAGLLASVLYVRAVVPDLPALRHGEVDRLALASVVYTADGEELTRFFRENRTWADLGQIAPVVVEALVATEDRRFWEHGGIDVVRIAGAARETMRGRRQGASTITMQLARNRFDAIGGTGMWHRKLSELVTALKIEAHYTKPEIVEMYLNTVPFGRRSHGIQQAAHTYFGVSAARLDAQQAALLIGLLRGPTHYDPLRHPKRARARRNLVLALMAEQGVTDYAALARLQDEPLGLHYTPPSSIAPLAPHFTEHVRVWLQRWAARHGADLFADGLRIHTTLSATLQRRANRALHHQLDALQHVAASEWSVRHPAVLADDPAAYDPLPNAFAHFWRTHRRLLNDLLRRTPRYRRLTARGTPPDQALDRLLADTALVDSAKAAFARLEAGLVAIEPESGRVRAWVGGRDFARDQYDKVALARRQPGSTFKPFVYAAAVERGYAPGDTLRFDATGRAVSLRDALAWSSNAAALRLVRDVGPHAAAETAQRLGIRSRIDPVPALALGSEEVTLLELASAYATLASGGLRHEPTVVARIEDRHGNVLYSAAPPSQRAVSPATAYTVVDMLRSVVDRGTGGDVRRLFSLQGDLAGKTGTSQENADGWFVLMHPRLVTAAWVGFNDRRLHFRTDHWGAGSHNALRVVGAFARSAQAEGLSLPPDARFRSPIGYRTPSAFRTARPDSILAAPDSTDYEIPRLEHDAESMLRATSAGPPPERSDPSLDAEMLLRRRLTETPRTTSGTHE